jgi:hypothetical protein
VREGGSFVAVSGTGGVFRRWGQGPGLGAFWCGGGVDASEKKMLIST